jgi:tetratricopeptide (TPR) repeat protein
MFCIISGNSSAQNQQLSTRNKKAEKLFFEALDSYQAQNYERALTTVQRAVELDREFTEAYLLKSDIYADLQQVSKAIESLQSAIQFCQSVNPKLYFNLAGMELSLGRYTDAGKNYERFLESGEVPDQLIMSARRGIRLCKFGEKSMANPVPFTPVNLGDSINTRYDEYINAVSADASQLYFTRWDPRGGDYNENQRSYNEEFYQCYRRDSVWCRALNLGTPINTDGNEGALTISPDGNYLFFCCLQ